MFKNLFNLSVNRKGAEIVGFYIVYSIIGALAGGLICGMILSIMYPDVKTFEESSKIAIIYTPSVAILYGVILSLYIIWSKRIFNSFHAVLLTIIAVPLLYFGGLIIGMIPVSFITGIEKS